MKINLKEKNGITLIALIITIIVMLILVAVTISMVVKGGLFDYASKATKDTKNAIAKEQETANGKIKIGDKVYNSIDEYLNGTGPKLKYTIEGNEIIISLEYSWEEYIAQKSQEDKEKAVITATGLNSFQEVLDMFCGEENATREMLVAKFLEFNPEFDSNFTYEEVLNLLCLEGRCFQKITVSEPNGEEWELDYRNEEESCITYPAYFLYYDILEFVAMDELGDSYTLKIRRKREREYIRKDT